VIRCSSLRPVICDFSSFLAGISAVNNYSGGYGISKDKRERGEDLKVSKACG
jgi:hypothetical protein